MHALCSGIPLVEGRSADDVAALLRAAAALFLPDLRHLVASGGAFAHAWHVELQALSLDPERLLPQRREAVESALAACVVDSSAPSRAADYCAAERLSSISSITMPASTPRIRSCRRVAPRGRVSMHESIPSTCPS